MKKLLSNQKQILVGIAAGVILFFAANLIIHTLFKKGLARYYCLEPAEILCIGHSMTEMGIDKTLLEEKTGLKIAKFCMNGAGIKDRLVMLKQYMESTGVKPKLVIYDVSARSFSEGLSTNSYALFYPFMDESEAIDKYIRKEASIWEYWQKKLILLSRYDDTRLGAVVRGYQGNWQNVQTRMFDTEFFAHEIQKGHFWRITFEQDAIKTFDETLKYLQDNGIAVLLLALPSVKQLNDAEPEKYQKAMAILTRRCSTRKKIKLLDFNPAFSCHSDLFFDPIHLNRNGQVKVTSALSTWIKENWK